MGRRVFIVAGEPSGERYAARLMAAWRQLDPEVEFIGIGGPRMEAEGLHSLVSLSRLSVVGFWEAMRHYGFFRGLLRRCEGIVRTQGVDAVLLVDYPGFNLRLAERVARLGKPVYYYIAPQTWAWGRWRLQTLARAVTLLLVAFPFEVEFFGQAGVRCTFVGHPLMDEPQLAHAPEPPERRPLQIALFPGSRPQELRYHLPLLQQVALELRRELPQATVAAAIPSAPWSASVAAEQLWKWHADPYGLLQTSRAGLVKVGTSTLEAALCGMPFVAFYRMSWLSYGIARLLVQLPSVVLVNVLLRAPIVPEFLQHRARPATLVGALLRLLDPEVARHQWESFQHLRALLGGPGVAQRAAAVLAAELERIPVKAA